jgi:hypothetical protein
MKKNTWLFLAIILPAGVFSPCPLSAEPVIVKTGVHIISLDCFDYSANRFNVTFWVWGFLSSENKNKTYTDGLEFIDTEFVQKEVEGRLPYQDGELVQQKFKAKLEHTWNMKNYPFIKDNLTLNLENISDVSSFRFVPDTEQSGISDRYTNSEWNIDGFSIEASEYTYNTNYGDSKRNSEGNIYSRLKVNIAISKKSPWITFLKLTASVYLFFLLSLLPFCMKPDTESRLSIPCATLFAVVSNQNIVDSIVPASTAITLLDSIHSLTQMMIIGIIAVLIVTNNLQSLRTLTDKTRSQRYDRAALVILPLVYAMANAILLRTCL